LGLVHTGPALVIDGFLLLFLGVRFAVDLGCSDGIDFPAVAGFQLVLEVRCTGGRLDGRVLAGAPAAGERDERKRSAEDTSALQSRFDLVCRLLLEKNKSIRHITY